MGFVGDKVEDVGWNGIVESFEGYIKYLVFIWYFLNVCNILGGL